MRTGSYHLDPNRPLGATGRQMMGSRMDDGNWSMTGQGLTMWE